MMMSKSFARFLLLSAAVSLAGCIPQNGGRELLEEAPILTPASPTALDLEGLP
jgi:hypothetical protein